MRRIIDRRILYKARANSDLSARGVDRLRRLEILDLQVMLVVGETGSFRKAGQRLQVGQPAVTRRVQKLEDALGVSLFERCATGAPGIRNPPQGAPDKLSPLALGSGDGP